MCTFQWRPSFDWIATAKRGALWFGHTCTENHPDAPFGFGMDLYFTRTAVTDFTLFDRDHKMFLNPWSINGCEDGPDEVDNVPGDYIVCHIEINYKDNANPGQLQDDFGILMPVEWDGLWWYTQQVLESPVKPYWPPNGYQLSHNYPVFNSEFPADELVNMLSQTVLLQDATIMDGLHVPQLRKIEYQLEQGRFIRYINLFFWNGDEVFETDAHGTLDEDQELLEYFFDEPVRSYRRNMIRKINGNKWRQNSLGFNEAFEVGGGRDWLVPPFNPFAPPNYFLLNSVVMVTENVIEFGKNDFFCGYNVVTADDGETGEEVFISLNFILC
jgi:hypothetical protein